MSPIASHTVAHVWSGYESDQEKFFRILLHDDRNSFYILSTDASGQWSDVGLKAESLSSYSFNLVSNYYMTHNGFTGKRRQTNRTRQLNALFFDLDCHGAQGSTCEKAVQEALDRIDEAIRRNSLPKPSIIVHSGRGVHLYYVLERSIPYRFKGSGDVNEKGVAYFQRIQNQLADVLEETVQDIPGIEVDRAVFDHTRVSRIPDTFNPKAGLYARLVSASETYYHLPDLASYKASLSNGLLSGSSALPKSDSKRKAPLVLNFHPLMMSRLGKVAELQAYRKYDCEGSRELMCFVYYNTAVQIYRKEDAKERLAAFNALFKKPLPQSELDGIVKSVSEVVNLKGEKGYYILKADTLVKLLSLTNQEILDLQFFASKKMAQRLEAKRKTKEKRDQRNKQIVDLYQEHGMTQQEVAAAMGCSVRTVQSVLKAAGATRRARKAKEARKAPLRDAAKVVLSACAKGSEETPRPKPAKNCPPCLSVVSYGNADFSLGLEGFLSPVSSSCFFFRLEDPGS